MEAKWRRPAEICGTCPGSPQVARAGVSVRGEVEESLRSPLCADIKSEHDTDTWLKLGTIWPFHHGGTH